MKLGVLGSNGMLGSAVVRYFIKNKIPFSKIDDRFDVDHASDFIGKVNQLQLDFLINCIGSIPQKNRDALEFATTNTMLPAYLVEHTNCFVIQPSTDCVFLAKDRGEEGFPSCQTPFSSNDMYGISKAVGDMVVGNSGSGLVVRASIIGLTEDNSSHGLLDWIVQNRHGKIDGFDNHFWNGITTDAWIHWVYRNVISKNLGPKMTGITHLGASDYMSKYEIIVLLNELMSLDIDIKKTTNEQSSDRRLLVSEPLGTIKELINDTIKFWS